MAYARTGITVNGVAPALIEGTKMLTEFSGTDEQMMSSKSPTSAVKDLCRVAEKLGRLRVRGEAPVCWLI